MDTKKIIKISYDEFVTKIKELQDILMKSAPTINSGGCGIFAYYMSKKLDELNIQHEIWAGVGNFFFQPSIKDRIISFKEEKVIVDKILSDSCKFEEKVEKVDNTSSGDMVPNHIFIKVIIKDKELWIDGHRIASEITSYSVTFPEDSENDNTCYTLVDKFDEEELDVLINIPHDWNDYFSRTLIPRIKKTINQFKL